jgi:CheY-like chemotaxis protein
MKPAVLFRLVLPAVWLWCAQPGLAREAPSSGTETPPLPPGSIAQQLLQEQSRERQELFRKRVAIPDAVGAAVQTEATASPRLAGGLPEDHRQNLLFAALFLLAGVLAIRRFASEIGGYLNRDSDPWALSPSTAANYSAKIRAEDEAFSEFVAAFQTGPSASPGATPATEWGPLQEFFAQAPKLLGKLRKLLQEIGRATDQAGRRSLLSDLQCELRALKGEAGLSELLPVWQMAAALEGLVKQLVGKQGNVTASTLRTVAGGVDLLERLCTPGLKADLLTNPPIRILAVDDDLISRNAVSFALRKALNPPELAADGEKAIARATLQAYDVIFLDVQMPRMDGFEVCTRIHDTLPNRDTPVVFVTCQSDFDARAQSTLSGGNDLIGKPFLTFEITVKALTLAMQGRLQGRARAADARPGQPLAGQGGFVTPPLGAESRGVAQRPPAMPATTTPDTVASIASSAPSANELAQAFVARASEHLGALRELIQAAFQTADGAARQEMLADFYLHLHALTPAADSAQGHPALRMSAALGGLLKKLLANPEHCNSSALLTVATAVDCLKDLCRPDVRPDAATNPPIRLLVVDDDPVARRALTGALQMAFGKPESANSGEAALALATDKPFDAIFMDVQMPGMDGFAACLRIHETAQNHTTPVAFVTGHSDLKARSQSSVSGGSDLIGKPFLTAEITVKALTLALRGRLQRRMMS